MPSDRPSFVLPDAKWDPVILRFNSVPISLFRTEGDPRLIHGWVKNPRIDMILRRWRHAGNRSADAYPDDDELLELMLQDDILNNREDRRTFSIKDLGEDVKRNGVRDSIIVTWDGTLIDGNRRKFAVMWALSSKGGASNDQRRLLERIPMLILPNDAPDYQKQSILVQENYAGSMKKEWPPVVANKALFDRYRELLDSNAGENDLTIRQHLRDEFPRFNVTDIMHRIETWHLIQEFRAEFGDELNEDEMERRINDQFNYFRQANDTFRRQNFYHDPEFRELIFQGIRHELFPSFAAVRRLDDIYGSPRAKEIFLEGEGMSPPQKRANYERARDEAGRERAIRDLTLDKRIESIINSLDNLTSVQLAEIAPELRARLEGALQRIIAQATISIDDANAAGETE